jgi:Short-chain dehydrogenases of various substrate specificities
VSSAGGIVAFPTGGIYEATKFAVEGLAEALAGEVAGFGIKVTIIEPGPFATDFMSESSIKQATPMPAYESVRQHLTSLLTAEAFGDPSATGEAILKVVDASAPPLSYPRQCNAAVDQTGLRGAPEDLGELGECLEGRARPQAGVTS